MGYLPIKYLIAQFYWTHFKALLYLLTLTIKSLYSYLSLRYAQYTNSNIFTFHDNEIKLIENIKCINHINEFITLLSYEFICI